MKFFILFCLSSATVFADNINQVTGSFEVSDEPHIELLKTQDSSYMTGTFSENRQKNRDPASLNLSSFEGRRELVVNELTGTFK